MSPSIQELYEARDYPAMSHPLSDPAVSAVAAMLGGLDVHHPAAGARILEIGCSSGHNLIPLAMRWPESRFAGIDLSDRAIRQARELAAAAGVANLEFHVADLRDFTPAGETFDFIIAHGFFSWVPDEVKAALFAFIHRHLAPSGIATVSFNLECGWLPRFPVIEKVRAIQQAGGVDEMTALGILRTVTESDSPELAIIDDMLAKGPGILPFDDFAPVNDPWPFEHFVRTASAAGLRWLGESHPGNNLPAGLDEDVLDVLRGETADPFAFQIAADTAAGRMFRSGVLCHESAAVHNSIPLKHLFDVFVRAGVAPANTRDKQIFEIIDSFSPYCVSLEEIHAALPELAWHDFTRRVYEGMHRGWILPRIEEVKFDPIPPERPMLNAFRLECARRGLPLVDLWHQPCSFPAAHFEVLAAMDGTRDRRELARLARERCPELAFEPWLRHLAGRGMFA
jgi:SAM-dependent methyltransferase